MIKLSSEAQARQQRMLELEQEAELLQQQLAYTTVKTEALKTQLAQRQHGHSIQTEELTQRKTALQSLLQQQKEWRCKWQDVGQRDSRLDQKIVLLQASRSKIQTQIARLQADSVNNNHSIQLLRQTLSQTDQQYQKAQVKIEEYRSGIERSRGRIGELQRQIASVEGQIGRVAGELE